MKEEVIEYFRLGTDIKRVKKMSLRLTQDRERN